MFSIRIRTELIALLLMGVSPAARADARTDGQARSEFQKAQKAYDLGRFSDALEGYSEAYRLDPRPAFLFNIAQCHRQLGDYEKSAFFFKRYLSYFPDSKAPNQSVVDDLIIEVTRKAVDARRKQEEAKAPADAPVNPPPLATAPIGPAAGGLQPSTVEEARPVVTRWWFWTSVGVVVTTAVVTAVLVSRPHPRGTTLEPGDLR
jgi:hypothetical protein